MCLNERSFIFDISTQSDWHALTHCLRHTILVAGNKTRSGPGPVPLYIFYEMIWIEAKAVCLSRLKMTELKGVGGTNRACASKMSQNHLQ